MQKQMKLTLPACVLFLCLPSVFAQEQIIPKPAEITLQKGAPATLTRDSAIVPDVRDKAFLNRATQLQQILSEGTGLPLPLKTPQDAPKNAANIIIPPYGQVTPCQISKIDKIKLFLIRKCTKPETIIDITHRPQWDMVLKIKFNSLIFSRTFKYTFDTTFVVKRESRKRRVKVQLSFPIHIIIQARSPLDTDTRSKAYICILKFIHKIGGRRNYGIYNHKLRFLNSRPPVSRKADT